LLEEFPLIPSTFVVSLIRKHRVLAATYPRLVDAVEEADDNPHTPPFKRLAHVRRHVHIPVLKRSAYWNEVSEELEYAKNALAGPKRVYST
jgi:hypothetical protein